MTKAYEIVGLRVSSRRVTVIQRRCLYDLPEQLNDNHKESSNIENSRYTTTFQELWIDRLTFYRR